jgi:hypothetical protein
MKTLKRHDAKDRQGSPGCSDLGLTCCAGLGGALRLRA